MDKSSSLICHNGQSKIFFQEERGKLQSSQVPYSLEHTHPYYLLPNLIVDESQAIKKRLQSTLYSDICFHRPVKKKTTNADPFSAFLSLKKRREKIIPSSTILSLFLLNERSYGEH